MMISKSDLGRIGLAIRGSKRSSTVMQKNKKHIFIYFSTLRFIKSDIDILIDDEVIEAVFELRYAGAGVYVALVKIKDIVEGLKKVPENQFKEIVEDIKNHLKASSKERVVLVNTELATYMSGGIEPTKKVIGMLIGHKVEMYKRLDEETDKVALIIDAEPWDEAKKITMLKTDNVHIRRIKSEPNKK